MADLRLVATVPDEEFHRTQAAKKRTRATERMEWALSCLAANVLRIVRGAGRPQDIHLQLIHALDGVAAYHEATGHMPPATDIARCLRLRTNADLTSGLLADGQITTADVARWESDGTVDQALAIETTIRGALQIAASRMVDQAMTERTGNAELLRGVEALERARKVRRKAFREGR
jgi:hypothetical protein